MFVGWLVGEVPGEDFVGPGDDGVDDAREFGEFVGLVEFAEPPEGFEGTGFVVGEVHAVKFLKGLVAGFESGVFREQLVEAGLVSFGERVRSSQKHEP